MDLASKEPPMRLIRNSFVALILLGIAWIGLARVSAPYRHNRTFQRKLPSFQKIISQLQSSEAILSSLTDIPVPDHAQNEIYSILAQRLADGRLAVEFLTGGGFPVKHRGFLFLSSGSIEDFPQVASRWPRREPLQDHWLYIGD